MLRYIVAVSFALAAGSSMADLVAENGRDSLRLTQSPCTNAKVLPLIREEHRGKFKAAYAIVAGQRFAACWADPGEGLYYIVFEDGDFSVLPITVFTERGI